MRRWAALAVPAIALTSSAAFADPPANVGAGDEAPATKPFGKHAATVFSVENVFGYVSTKFQTGSSDTGGSSSKDSGSFFGGGDASVTSSGMLWPYLVHVGIFGIAEGGFSAGVLLSPMYFRDNGHGTFVGDLRPRLGYAAAINPTVGAWLRAGPNLLLAVPGEGDTSWAFGAGGEALLVVTPAPHFGVLGGLTLDFPITGSSHGGSTHDAFATSGLTLGLMADF